MPRAPPDEGRGVLELPAHHVGPLVQPQRQVAVAADPLRDERGVVCGGSSHTTPVPTPAAPPFPRARPHLRIVGVHDSLRSGADRDRALQLAVAAARHPGHLRGAGRGEACVEHREHRAWVSAATARAQSPQSTDPHLGRKALHVLLLSHQHILCKVWVAGISAHTRLRVVAAGGRLCTPPPACDEQRKVGVLHAHRLDARVKPVLDLVPDRKRPGAQDVAAWAQQQTMEGSASEGRGGGGQRHDAGGPRPRAGGLEQAPRQPPGCTPT